MGCRRMASRMDDLEAMLTAAAFYEQVAGDFPEEELCLPGGVTWTRRPVRGWRVRLRVWWLWMVQGRVRHRAVITCVGSTWHEGGRWTVDGFCFDGRYCPGVPALHYEVVGDVSFLRAVCGWHLPDLEAAASGLRIRSIW